MYHQLAVSDYVASAVVACIAVMGHMIDNSMHEYAC